VPEESPVTGACDSGVGEALPAIRSEMGMEDAAAMTSRVERQARRLRVPWTEDTPDAKGFWNFVADHYLRCDRLAWNLTRDMGYNGEEAMAMITQIFNKLASPLVYLWDQWATKSPEEKARWEPAILAKAKEHREAVEKAWERAEAKRGEGDE